METSPRTRQRRRRRRLLAFLVSAMAVGTVTTTALSLALFTAQTTVAATGFTTGTIGITNDHTTTALFNLPAMMPDDPAVTEPLVVSSTGTAELRYSMTSTATDDGRGLRDVLTLEVRTVGSGCAAFDGTVLYSGAIGAAAFGSSAEGQDTNDQVLAPLASQTLCFRVKLPRGASDGVQGATTNVSFAFDAEQTANNPEPEGCTEAGRDSSRRRVAAVSLRSAEGRGDR